MNFEPQKFFIGHMDYFSILLPGALLTWLLIREVVSPVLGDRSAQLVGAEGIGMGISVSDLVLI